MFPYVFTAARLTEHHTAGGMSRTLPYLSELQPALFVEVSPELARERGLHHLDWAHVITSRTAVEARVLVTDRMVPLRVDGQVVHQVWMPYHWGQSGLTSGDVVNDLIGVVVDPNVFIQESKVLTCDVRPGRRPRGPALLDYVAGVPAPGRRHPGDRHADQDGRRHDGPAAHRTARPRPACPERRTGMTSEHRKPGEHSFYGPLDDPAADAGYPEHPPRVGFFTDTSVCIGCKACEVACKEWNNVPEDGLNLLGMSFDNTGMLGANSWRHVAFIEQDRRLGVRMRGWQACPPGRPPATRTPL